VFSALLSVGCGAFVGILPAIRMATPVAIALGFVADAADRWEDWRRAWSTGSLCGASG